MVSASTPSPDGAVDNDRHHHHDHHTVEVAGEAVVVDSVSGNPSPTPDDDPIAVNEAALVRLVDDVGVLAEEDVVQAFSILKGHGPAQLPALAPRRHAANRGGSVTVLGKLSGIRCRLTGWLNWMWSRRSMPDVRPSPPACAPRL